MLQKQYTTFLNTPILNQETGDKVGEIYDFIIDPETGKIEAFWVKQGVFYGAEKILAFNDILELKLKVYIEDEDSILNPDEILKVQEILQKGIGLYYHKVKTLSGIRLGRVTDFFFDPISGQVMQIQVTKNFLGFKYAKRLIAFFEIYEITEDAVILKDDFKYTALKVKDTLDLTEAV